MTAIPLTSLKGRVVEVWMSKWGFSQRTRTSPEINFGASNAIYSPIASITKEALVLFGKTCWAISAFFNPI